MVLNFTDFRLWGAGTCGRAGALPGRSAASCCRGPGALCCVSPGPCKTQAGGLTWPAVPSQSTVDPVKVEGSAWESGQDCLQQRSKEMPLGVGRGT